jgi:hypothetical protein
MTIVEPANAATIATIAIKFNFDVDIQISLI